MAGEGRCELPPQQRPRTNPPSQTRELYCPNHERERRIRIRNAHLGGGNPLSIAIFDHNKLISLIVSQIFSGRDPFLRDLDAAVVHRVLRGDRPPRPDHVGLSHQMWKMVKSCCDPQSRRMKIGDVVALIEEELSLQVSKRPKSISCRAASNLLFLGYSDLYAPCRSGSPRHFLCQTVIFK